MATMMSLKPLRAALRPSTRGFRSPFAVLGTSHSQPGPSAPPSPYQKQHDYLTPSPEAPPTVYVVSAPDAADHFHSVPTGAFPISTPYTSFSSAPPHASTSTSPTNGPHESSTSSARFAHPITTRRAPSHPAGESAAVRWGATAGAMSARSGGSGGIKLMDRDGTVYPARGTALADRNQPPIGDAGEEMGRINPEAWGARK